MKVLVSILNWNQEVKTLACLESVLNLPHDNLEVCVTDNDSVSFDEKTFSSRFPKVKIFKNSLNAGYAGGHQQALDHALRIGTDAFWILNNDVGLFRDTLDHLINAYETHGEALYGSRGVDVRGEACHDEIWKIRHKNKQLTCSFSAFDPSELASTKTLQVANLIGYSLFIPTPIIKKYGFIDPSFFLYFEETDYSIRLLKEGIFSYWVGNSIVVHEDKGSSAGHQCLSMIIEYYLFRNFHRLMIQHAPKMHVIIYLMSFLKSCMKDFLSNRGRLSVKYRFQFQGVLHAFLGVKGNYYKPEDYIDIQS